VSATPPAVLAVARRLWPAEVGSSETPAQLATAASALCAQLRSGLGSWIGPDAFETLLQRALDRAAAAHSALASIKAQGGSLDGLGPAAEAHGPAKVRAGVLAVVTALIELLSRLIGEEIALRLVQPSSQDGRQRAEPQAKGRDDA